jgi:hypothetical protein
LSFDKIDPPPKYSANDVGQVGGVSFYYLFINKNRLRYLYEHFKLLFEKFLK